MCSSKNAKRSGGMKQCGGFLLYVSLFPAIAEGMMVQVQESGRLALVAAGQFESLSDIEPL